MVKEFDAQLSKGDNPGAWTCVILTTTSTRCSARAGS